MATTPRSLTINLDVQNPKSALIKSIANPQQAQAPQYTLGDMLPHNLFLGSTQNGIFGYDPNSGSGSYSVKVGVGFPGGVPTSGTFTLTLTTGLGGPSTTSALAYNVTAAAMQAALVALTAIGANNCSVTGQFPTWEIQFIGSLANTSVSLFTANTTALYPFSNAAISNEQAGGGGNNAIQVVQLAANPVVLQTSWAAVTQTIASGLPTGGTFKLSFGGYQTSGIAYNAIAATIQTAFVALTSVGSGNATVSGQFPNFSITFISALGALPQPLITIDASSLTPTSSATIAEAQRGGGAFNEVQTLTMFATSTQNIGWLGQLNFNTGPLIDLFDNNGGTPLPQIAPNLEIEIIDGSGNIVTWLSIPIVIYHRVIQGAAMSAPPANSIVGTFTLPNGFNSGAVTGLGLSVAPRIVCVLGVARNTGSLLLNWIPNLSIAYTTDGFHYNLSGNTDQADYLLQYMLVF